MANLAVTNTLLSGATILASDHNTNYSDIVTYINNRNGGTADWDVLSVLGAATLKSTLAVTGASTLGTAVTISPTSNQLVLGATRTVTITAPTPASSSRTITLADLSGDYSVVGTIGNQTISGVKTFSGQLIAKGTATNDSANAGDIGEHKNSAVSSVSLATSTQYGDLTSLSLTAGDWLVSAVVEFPVNAGNQLTDALVGISSTSGNASTGLNIGDNLTRNSAFSGACTLVVPAYRISLASTTTHYLKVQATYPGGSPVAHGRLSAVRIR